MIVRNIKENKNSEKMSKERKSAKILGVVTSLTILGLVLVEVVSAAFLATFNGTPVTVNDNLSGTVTYSTDGGLTWSSTAPAFNSNNSWQARFEVKSSSISGSATLTWQLKNTGTWTNVGSPVSTSVSSIKPGQSIYASSNGASSGNHNWGTDISTGGSYRVIVTVSST
jgi:hypothetical protein